MNSFIKNLDTNVNTTVKRYVEKAGIYSGYLIDMYWQIVHPANIVVDIEEPFTDTIVMKINKISDLANKFAQVVYKEGGAKFVEIREKPTHYELEIPSLDSACYIKIAFSEKDAKKAFELEEKEHEIEYLGKKEVLFPRSSKILRPLFLVDGMYNFDVNYDVNENKERYWEKYNVNSFSENNTFCSIEKSLLNKLAFVVPTFSEDKMQKRPYDLKEETIEGIWYSEQERFLNQFYNFINYFTGFDNSFRETVKDKLLLDTITEENIHKFGVRTKWSPTERRYTADVDSDGNIRYKQKIGATVLNLFSNDFWVTLFEESIKFIKGLKDLSQKRIELCIIYTLGYSRDSKTGKFKENLYIQFPKRSQIFRAPSYCMLPGNKIGIKVGDMVKTINFNYDLMMSVSEIFPYKDYPETKYSFILSKEEQTLLAMADRLEKENDDTKEIKKDEPVISEIENDDDLPF